MEKLKEINHKIVNNEYYITDSDGKEVFKLELINDPKFPGWIKLTTNNSVYCGPLSLLHIE